MARPMGALSHLSLSSIGWSLFGLFLAYRVGLMIWRVYFHPLARFPGPKHWAASYLPYVTQNMIMGTLAKDMVKIHEKYGPIVRISPNRLSVDGSIGWPQVFARRAQKTEFSKAPESYGLKNRIGIFSSLREDHRRQRRLLAHAFSETALIEQEGYIKFYVDLLMTQLRKEMQAGRAVDFTRWYNYLTFDIIGELAFGDPFHSLEKSDYHPWVALIFSSIRAGARLSVLRHYPLLRPLLYWAIGKDNIEKRRQSAELARVKTEKRLAMPASSRKDFMSYVLRNDKDGHAMSHEEIIVNSRALIIAGSETTATALSGLTFHLTHNKDIYDMLVDEIRGAFASEEQITIKSTAPLQFLHACLEEVLRIYPPAGETPPRVSPGDVINGQYVPEGTYITVYQWATHHSPLNFADPDSFKPQRFLPSTHPRYEDRYSDDNKAAFKPFAAGPRDCIGKNLAYAEMRVVIARLLWNFDLQVVEGQEDWVSRQRTFVVYEKGPLFVRLKPRVMV